MSASLNAWGLLARLCVTLRRLVYVKHDTDAARAYLPQLKSLLGKLPKKNIAIVAAEGRAIYHELRGNINLAISYRVREVELMERLYDHIRTHDYDESTKKYMLAGRDEAAFKTRKKIIRSLRRKLNS